MIPQQHNLSEPVCNVRRHVTRLFTDTGQQAHQYWLIRDCEREYMAVKDELDPVTKMFYYRNEYCRPPRKKHNVDSRRT